MSRHEIPQELITDTETKAVTLTPELEAALPGIEQAFADVDQTFLENPERYLQNLESSVFRLDTNGEHGSKGVDVNCSLLYKPDSKTDEMLVIFAPFADRHPNSSAKDLHEYITADVGGFRAQAKAKPNTWNQTTKSATVLELLHALGKGMPVLTIYSPIPTEAYSSNNKRSIKQGDFYPVSNIAEEAIAAAQDRLHGKYSQTRIDKLHFSGASLGASNSIGAAEGLIYTDRDIRTVTAQELIMGPTSLLDLGKRFTISQHVGEASEKAVANLYPIEEPALRQQIDKHGSEIIGTTARMIKAMKPVYMRGLTKPGVTIDAIESLLDNNVNVLVALAENSSLTHQTASHLPNYGERVVKIKAEKGQKIGHIADEHVALSAIINALNITKN